LPYGREVREMYGYKCEYCEGTVKERLVKKEVFKHKSGFIMLENVPVGICDRCGYRYYHYTILKRVEEIAEGKRAPERTESIPVAHCF
jgi:YgiT-type zinc finger domain-containing protein